MSRLCDHFHRCHDFECDWAESAVGAPVKCITCGGIGHVLPEEHQCVDDDMRCRHCAPTVAQRQFDRRLGRLSMGERGEP